MHHAIIRYATKVPTVCAVCRRHAWWIGYSRRPHAVRNITWLCNRNQCHAVARRFYAMSGEQFDEYELGAMLEAGRSAGSYLDEIGKTDLKLLSGEEWREFLFRLLTGYEQALRRKLLNGEPPL
jgi:Family of unknown function (DUF6511)